MRSSPYLKTISRILILAMLHLCWLTSYGYAEMVPSKSANQIQDDRQRILNLLNRQEVVNELEKHGISKVEAVARINSLTDEEAAALVAEIDHLPEGGQYGGIPVLVFAAGMIVMYILAVLFKGIECIFSDCEAKGGLSYVFRPPWKEDESPITSDEEDCDPGMESCDSRIENRSSSSYDYEWGEGNVIEDCDPREGICGEYGDNDSKGETVMHPYCDPGIESCDWCPLLAESCPSCN